MIALSTAVTTVLLVALLRAQESLAFQGIQPRAPPPSTKYVALKESISQSQPTPIDEELCHDGLVNKIRQWTEQAIEKRGTSDGLQALEYLGRTCQQRLPYDFDEKRENLNNNKNVKPIQQLIPKSVCVEVSKIVKEMEAQGWLSTNLDSVDGLPSFHLNLVSNGKPLFQKDTEDPFGRKIRQLLDLVGPYIYDNLLPHARDIVGKSDRIQVDDIFLRRYGQDSEDARNGISAHYDVFSHVTSVIAMDDSAAEGNNGLFTTVLGAAGDNTSGGDDDDGAGSSRKAAASSNHASLRRYFPLKEGDAVLHTWDVLHGVDVLPGSDRTSLIVWFAEPSVDGNNEASSSSVVSPWLLEDPERVATDDVNQFVLASALASAEEIATEKDGNDAAMHHPPSESTLPTPSSSLENGDGDSSSPGHKSQLLYLKSAANGNVFAMTRVGSICEANEWINEELQKEAQRVLKGLGTEENLPTLLQKTKVDTAQMMSWQFWYEAAIRGNPFAQLALAEDLLVHSCSIQDNDDDDDSSNNDAHQFRLLATVLLGLAAQQGMENAFDGLVRAVQLEVSAQGIENQVDFVNSAVVQTAQAATDGGL